MIADSTNDPTTAYLGLTPDRILAAIEATGLPCTPLCDPLNSFENRVYDLQLRDGTRLVAKFYRPGRWSDAQIRDEHDLLRELDEAEVPVGAVRPFPDGTTLQHAGAIAFALFERKGGRAPEDVDDALATRLGMLVGRLHNVAAARPAPHRLRLDAATFVRAPLDFLLAGEAGASRNASGGGGRGHLPATLAPRYARAARELADLLDERLAGLPTHRLHGDLHSGNLVLRDGVLHVLDFDDLMTGPAVQDLWLLLPGRDATTLHQREQFLAGYEQFRAFDRTTLALIEPLRGMRYVHYSAWLARRWHDPIFPATWPHFGTPEYWRGCLDDLEDVLDCAHAGPQAVAAPVAAADGQRELTNADFFWDLPEGAVQ